MTRRLITLIILAAFCESLAFSSCAKQKPLPETPTLSENRVLISGSASVTPLLKTLAREFSKDETDIEILFPPDSHSNAGIAGTAENQYDIGTISREMSPKEKETGLRYLHLAVDGLVFATNENVKIATLSTDQIRDIYAGKIKNWAQLGGPDAEIEVIDRPEHTSAKIAFRRTFLGDDFPVDPDLITIERPWQVIESIRLLSYSIGYTSLGDIVSENPPVNIISVNGVAPTLLGIKKGRYKFFRPFGLVLGPAPNASTMKFVNFIFSDNGSRIIERSGYVPQRYEILVGIVPEQNVMIQKQRYEPLVNYLSHKLGERFSVELKLFPSYIEVCQSLVSGDINAAFLGSLAYTAVHEYVNVLARPDYAGVSQYRGIIFTRTQDNINNLAHMRGRRLVMGGRMTTAGHVFPLYYFKKNGIDDYQTYFSESNYVGTHEDAILTVLHNRADVGAAKDLIYNMLVKENPILERSLKVLAESPAVPSNAFVLRKDLALPCFDCHIRMRGKDIMDASMPDQRDIGTTITELLLVMPEDSAGRDALAALGNATGFLETADSDYSELYRMLKEINLDPEQLLESEGRDFR